MRGGGSSKTWPQIGKTPGLRTSVEVVSEFSVGGGGSRRNGEIAAL